MSLLHEVLENGKVKKRPKQQKGGKALPKMRKVQLGWLHFDDEKQSFVSVRTAKSGGTREVDIKHWHCQDHEQLMAFGLANFQHKDISFGIYTATLCGEMQDVQSQAVLDFKDQHFR